MPSFKLESNNENITPKYIKSQIIQKYLPNFIDNGSDKATENTWLNKLFYTITFSYKNPLIRMLQNNFSRQWNSTSKLPFMGDHNTSLCSWQLVGMQYAYPFASHKTFFLHCTPMAPPLILAIKVVTHINACLILVLLVQLLLSMGYITIDNITFNSNICQHIVDYIPREVNPSMNLSWTCACYLSGL